MASRLRVIRLEQQMCAQGLHAQFNNMLRVQKEETFKRFVCVPHVCATMCMTHVCGCHVCRCRMYGCHVCGCLHQPEEGVRSRGTGVEGSCEPQQNSGTL